MELDRLLQRTRSSLIEFIAYPDNSNTEFPLPPPSEITQTTDKMDTSRWMDIIEIFFSEVVTGQNSQNFPLLSRKWKPSNRERSKWHSFFSCSLSRRFHFGYAHEKGRGKKGKRKNPWKWRHVGKSQRKRKEGERERERERGKERKESIFRTLVAFNLASFSGKLICGHA